MDRLGAGLLRRLDDLLDAQIAFGRHRRADQESLVRLAHMRRIPIDLGINGDGPDLHLLQGPRDPDRDLAAVGNEHLLEHGGAVYSAATDEKGLGSSGRRAVRLPSDTLVK